MTFKEYTALAMRTSPEMQWELRVLNGTMGLVGEAGEIMDLLKKHRFQSAVDAPLPKDKLIEELGDVMWYCAQVADAMELTVLPRIDVADLHQMEGVRYHPNFLIDMAFRLCEEVLSVRKPGDEMSATLSLRKVLNILARICECIGCTLNDAAERNIEKLKRRYPDGFDPERSANRSE